MKTTERAELSIDLSDDYSAQKHITARSGVTKAPSVSGLRRALYLLVAGGFFALAIAGVILPGLPTTPFLLLTSYFLVRSNPRLNDRLLRSRLFGPILVDWQVRGGVRSDVKAKAISAVLIAVGFSIYLTHLALVPSLIITTFAFTGVVVILKLPTPRD